MLIRPRPPFDFAQTLRFTLAPPPLLNGRVFEPLLDYLVEGEYRRVIMLNGHLVLFGVRGEGTVSDPRLRIRILAGRDDAATRKGVRAAVTRQFSTDIDLEPFYDLASADPVLHHLARQFHGMRIPLHTEAYEILISAIIEQQVNLSFAHKVKKAVIEKYGRAIKFEGRSYHSFPDPAVLAKTTAAELLPLQVSGPKARYIIEISRLVAEKQLDLAALTTIEPAAAHEKLLGLLGVGHWTAQYVGLRSLGHLDCLPAADVGLQKVIQHFYRLRKRPNPERVHRMARVWRGWRSYATFYLWLTYWENAEWKARARSEIWGERQPSKSSASGAAAAKVKRKKA